MMYRDRRVLAILAAAWACAPGPATSAAVDRAADTSSTALAPSTVTLQSAPNVFADASTAFTADALLQSDSDAQGSTSWWSDDSNIVAINQHGVAVGRAPGTTRIRASAGTRTASALVSVVPGDDSTIEIIAHRGFMRRFPENTLVAVRGAFENGADAVEVDIRLSRDGVPVVMHDETVDRTTNGHGAVKDLTSSQLFALNACAHAAGTVTSCPLPAMRDVLTAARGHGGVVLHMYGAYTLDDLRGILQTIREVGMEGKTMFICFDYSTLRQLRQLDPVVPLGYLVTGLVPLEQVDALGRAAALLELQASLNVGVQTRTYLVDAHRRRIDAGVWVAVDQSQARAAVALGFRHLIADVPIDRTALMP